MKSMHDVVREQMEIEMFGTLDYPEEDNQIIVVEQQDDYRMYGFDGMFQEAEERINRLPYVNNPDEYQTMKMFDALNKILFEVFKNSHYCWSIKQEPRWFVVSFADTITGKVKNNKLHYTYNPAGKTENETKCSLNNETVSGLTMLGLKVLLMSQTKKDK